MLRSIGYLGTGLEGIPFDASRGLIPNEAGRVVDPETGEQVPGHYAVGWIKRGPSGVIGTNKKDAAETVDTIFEDLEAGPIPEPDGRAGLSRSRSCWMSAAATTSPTWAGRRSTPPRSAPASRTAARG